MLDPRGERIQDDLRGILKGEVRCHTIDTQPFATDASIYEKRPLCVVFPKTTMDIVSTVRYARSQKLSIHPRGGGSGCVGGALGEGIVLDLSRFMRRILAIDKNVLKVQAGAQCALLQGYLRHSGRTIGSCGRNSHAKTIGGLLAVDGYGSHWLSGGRPSDWLLGLEMVTANGTILSLTREEKWTSWKESETSDTSFPFVLEESSFQGREKERLAASIAKILQDEREFLKTTRPRHVIDKMGYRLDGLQGNTLDMARLIAGSEGTLGIITTATLQLQQAPAFRQSALFLFENLEKATLAIPYILQYHPDACEWIDRRHLHLAAEQDVRFDVMFPPQTEVVLLLDFSHEKQYNLRNQLRSIADLLIHQKELSFSMIPASNEAEATLFWELTNTLYPTAQRHVRNPIRIPFVEDVAVPPQQLRELILKIQELLRQYEMTASLHAHAGQGQVRLLPLEDLHSPQQIAQLLRFTEAYYRLIREMGGSIGAENGIGLGRIGWLPFFQGKRYNLNRAIKKIFDPEGIFQPGKLGSDIPAPQPTSDVKIPFLRSEFTRNQMPEEPLPVENPPLREGSANVLEEGDALFNERDPSGILVMEQVRQILGNYFDEEKDETTDGKNLPLTEEKDGANPAQNAVEKMGLEWDLVEMCQTAFQCNGCADCRGMERETRSCPIFRLSHSEYATPRAKANLLNGFLTGQLELSEVGEAAFHDIIQQCFQCHSCRTECPAQVDIPLLVRRSQEAWARVRGHNFYETAMARLENWLGTQYRIASLTHVLFASPWFRWFFEKMFGIARQRSFPPVEFRSFLDQIRNLPPEECEERPFFQENSTEIHGKVVYFLDTYANYLDTSLAYATVRVFTHNDIPILVPQHQSASGLMSVMLGRNSSILKQVARNAAILADYVRQGYDVILTEPSITLAFRWEYPQTFPENEDIALISKHVYDAGEYLYKAHLLQQLRLPHKPLPISLGYHAPCRLQALKIGLPFVHLLQLIPQLEVEVSRAGCCGMGGFFGMQATNYLASLRIGRPLHTWLRYPTLQAGVTECTACKLQMEHKTTKPILHPMKILARAYGIMPELDGIFRKKRT